MQTHSNGRFIVGAFDQLAGQSDLTAQVITALNALDTSARPDSATELLSKLPPAALNEINDAEREKQQNVTALVIDALTSSAQNEI